MQKISLNRRHFLGFGALSAGALTLAACSEDSGAGALNTAAAVNTAAGAAAAADVVAKSEWAAAIKKRGTLRLGCTDTSDVWSFKDPASGDYTGFDAGIAALLAKYILGDATKITRTLVSVSTRETLLQNDNVDVVIATYSITDERKKKIGFAGPYFEPNTGILVKTADKDKFTTLESLKGKKVITQSASANVQILNKAGITDLVLLSGNSDCTTALIQGRGDAYVNDLGLLYGQLAKNKDKVAAVDLGVAADKYGIGHKLNAPGAADFLKGFLTEIGKAEWGTLYKETISKYVPGDVPAAPVPA